MTDGKSNFDPNSNPNSEISAAPTPACDRVRPELKAYLDGQTGWWRQRSLRAHVAQCPLCREEMEAMRDFSDNLRGAEAETLDPVLRAKILAAVPHTPPALAEARPAWRNRRRPLFLVGAAASAALIGAVLYPALNSQNTPAVESATSETSVSSAMKTAASAPSLAAPADKNGPIDTAGTVSESAGKDSYAPAKAAGQLRNGVMPAAPAAASPPEETKSTEAKSSAEKPVGGLMASAQTFRSVPKSLPGGVSGKSPAKSVQDVTFSAESSVAPSDITVQVRDVETCSADVEQKALAAGGKIVLSALSTSVDKTSSATLTLKIPVSRLSGFLTQVAHLGQLQSRQTRPEDADKSGRATAEAKASVPHRRQETLVPVTVNLKSRQ